MKKIFTLLAIVFTAYTSNAQNKWVSCGAAVANTWSLNGGTCNVTNFNINNQTDSVFILAGFTRPMTTFNSSINGVVIVSGTLDLGAGNNTLNINSNGRLIVRSGGQITGGGNASVTNNGFLVVEEGASLTTGGGGNASFSINGNGVAVIDGTVNCSDFTNNGVITGSGTINFSDAFSNNGTINGITGNITSPIVLNSTGYIWNGSTWTPSAPNGLEDRAIFNGNYTFSTDPAYVSVFPAGGITINSGFTVTFDSDVNLSNVTSVQIDGAIELVDNTQIGTTIFKSPSNTGLVKLTRNFSTNSGWNHIGWPLSGGATVGDLTTTGFALNTTGPNANQINVYYWDAATAGWLVPSAGTSLVGRPLSIYNFNTGTSVSLTVSVANFNNAPLSQSYTYFDPGMALPGNGTGWANATTDGWNMWVNPYQQNLNPDLMALPVNLDNAVYAFNGVDYTSRVAGVGALTGIGVNQAFFVRTDANNGSFSIPLAARTTASAPSFFKNGDVVELILQGEGFTNQTFIYENSAATANFDKDFDAFYFAHTTDAPHFNSVGSDSTAYSIQALPELNLSELYLTFYYGTNNKNFTIAVDQSQISSLTTLMLHDLHTGTNTDLLQGSYTFTSTKQAPEQRFKLSFTTSGVGVAEIEKGQNINVWFQESELRFTDFEGIENAEVMIFNTNGQLVAQGNAQAPIYIHQNGVYIVRINTKDGHSHNVKVVKM